MPDDLVERLRRGGECESPCRVMEADSGCLCAEAADRITALTARLAELECATPEEVVEMAARALRNTPLMVPGTLFDLLRTTTYANNHVIALLLKDAALNAVSAIAALLRAQGAWQPIETAPQDRPIVVYAPARDGLQEMASICQWHPDAGFCIDELREPTHWTPIPAIRAGGSAG